MWDAAESYERDDAVSHGGGSYVASEANAGEEPPGGAWVPLAQRGAAGPTGPAGPSGLARPGFTSTVLDPGQVGSQVGLAIGMDGLGLIAWQTWGASGGLQVAHCEDLACTSTTQTLVDAAGGAGAWPSVAIGADGLGLISYADGDDGDLKVAHCDDVACTSAAVSTLESASNVGFGTSIAIGADGLGLISYRNIDNGDLRVAHCQDLECSAATLTSLDAAPVQAYSPTSITVGTDGYGLIAYDSLLNEGADIDLKVAHCDDAACTSASVSTVDGLGLVGWFPAITLGPDGYGLISYAHTSSGQLKVARCTNLACSTSVLAAVLNSYVRDTAIALGPDGQAVIAYQDPLGNLGVARCRTAGCASASIAGAGSYATNPAVAFGADGMPVVVYRDDEYHLRAVHFANLFGVPHKRGR